MSLVQIETKELTGRKYWRSLNELSGTPAFREWVTNEFPGGAEMLDGASRRNVLKLMAASFGLAGLAACSRPEEKIVPLSRGVEDLIPGKPYYYNTVYTQGGNAIGLTVEAHDGRPTKIEGNKNHPQSTGASSGYAQASILNIYDPDRSSEVLKDGKTAKWADWDQFAGQKFSEGSLGRGAGLRILSEAVLSPSLIEVRKSLLGKFPEAKWVEYEAFSNENALAGSRIVFGQPYHANYHYDKADVVVSLDADFLGIDSNSPLSTKRFSKKRRSEKPEDEINRLYVIENQFSVTGAMADHRIRSKASDVDGFASALARELGVLAELSILSGSKDQVQKILMAIVRDLKKNAGKSIVVAGPRQSARVHALALMINQALGNIGTTVTFTQPVANTEAQALADLAGELNAGRVDTLLILGSNPVFTAPAGLKFADAIKRAKTTVHLGADRDETSVVSNWHLPLASYLESWGDARSVDGVVAIQQPLILPINKGRSVLEVAAQVAGYKDRKSYDIVKNYWTAQWPAAEREARFRKALHDGVIAGTEFVEVKVSFDPKRIALPAAPAKSAQVEVVFVPSWSVYDGRFTNNAWMQEAPDPMTKLVWDNAALLSPATAEKLGVVDGNLLNITANGQSLEIAAMIQPGHADDSITIPCGYGRKEVGRVGKGTGFNAFALKAGASSIQFASDVSNTRKQYQLVTTQAFHSMTEPKLSPLEPATRPIVREASVDEYRHHPEFAKHMVHAPDESIYGWWDYSEGNQWGMAIDLNSCIGCNACIIACQSENNVPVVGKEQTSYGRTMHWIRLDRYYTGDAEDPQAVIQPLSCQQCENAPCESVCPVAATTHSPEGLNDMAYNRCVGTRYCANNCPYKVRRFNFLNYHKELVDVEKMVANPDVTVRMRGIMEKCTYCVQRIQEAKIQAKVDGRRDLKDGDIVPACQQVCAADAVVFGNINDPESQVSKLKNQPRNYALLAEVNTRPRTTYLAKLRNPNPELVEHEHHG